MAIELKDLFSNNFFNDRKILIDEKNTVNVDFLIRDLSCLLNNPSIFLYNELPENKSFYGINIKSEYKGDIYSNETFLDHTFIAKNLFNVTPNSQFSIYRDNTCTKYDWYNYDFIFLVEPLASGLCVKFDGMITIKNRHKEFIKLKYKSYTSKTEYFEF
ncbi:elongator complex protein 6 [Vairimorpha necatrix]|uniref:Elongator complex protein 6 n=1 Tax=Vairimorpha necatrix TaxID=6039 RepID=A0AAX4J8V7_9MICR